MLREEATHTNFIVFGLTRPGFEPTIYRSRGEHATLAFQIAKIRRVIEQRAEIRECALAHERIVVVVPLRVNPISVKLNIISK